MVSTRVIPIHEYALCVFYATMKKQETKTNRHKHEVFKEF